MFNSPEGSLESIFVNDYDMIDQYAKTGSLWSWGYNYNGQIGDGTTVSKSSPVQTVAGGTNWKQVSRDGSTSAAIKTDGTLWMWGYNPWGGLGDNSSTDKSSPVQTVAGGTNWKQVSTDSGGATAAIKTDGTLWTWGFTSNPSGVDVGSLGDNTTVNKSSPVQTIAGGTNWKQVSANQNMAAIKTDGTLWVWGYNLWGNLGIGTSGSGTNKSSPVQTVAGGTNWKQVSAGGNTTAAIKTDGTLWVWGYNYSGQLGDGTTVDKSSPVQTVAGGTTWKQVSTGGNNTAAIKTDGTLWIWGYNNVGQLGNGTTVDKSSPVQTVSGGTTWKQVSAGGGTAAIKTDGTLWMWGDNEYGQIGDGTTVDKSSPVQTVAGGTNWKQVSDGAAIYFYDAGNLYPGGGGSGSGPFSATITSDQQELNLRTWALANGWDGSSAATITIGSGVYIWSDSNSTAALTINGSWPAGITLINNGVIMGKGGPGYPATAGAGTGGPAISLGVNATITNNNYVLGGGGAGQAGYTYINSNWGYANVGGGGGAGGGVGGGGWFSGGTYGLVSTSTGGAGGQRPMSRTPSTGGYYSASYPYSYWEDQYDSGAWLGTTIFWQGSQITDPDYWYGQKTVFTQDGSSANYTYYRGNLVSGGGGNAGGVYEIYRTTSPVGGLGSQSSGGAGAGGGGGGGGYYNGSGGSLYAGGGGGGGRSIDEWYGGAGASSGSYAGGGTVISGTGGYGLFAGQNYQASLGAGGGGGYGAAGGTGNGTGPYGGGGAGGKAIALNGYTATYTNNSASYGAVS